MQKVPPLFHAARAAQAASRTVFGPSWLKRQVQRQVIAGGPLRIVIGSSQAFDPGWIPTNVQYLNLLVAEHWQRAFHDQKLDAVLAEHVWEHLTPELGKAAAAQCFKYLRPGGYLRIAVPDGNHPDPAYIDFVRPCGHGPGCFDHKILYTCDTFRDMLRDAGFEVELLEYYDAKGVFHSVDWESEQGSIQRRKGWTEKQPDGSVIQYTSLIADARKRAD